MPFFHFGKVTVGALQLFTPLAAVFVVALTIAINQAVFAFAPAILGALRDLSGGYAMAFLGVAALQSLAAAAVTWGRRFS